MGEAFSGMLRHWQTLFHTPCKSRGCICRVTDSHRAVPPHNNGSKLQMVAECRWGSVSWDRNLTFTLCAGDPLCKQFLPLKMLEISGQSSLQPSQEGAAMRSKPPTPFQSWPTPFSTTATVPPCKPVYFVQLFLIRWQEWSHKLFRPSQQKYSTWENRHKKATTPKVLLVPWMGMERRNGWHLFLIKTHESLQLLTEDPVLGSTVPNTSCFITSLFKAICFYWPLTTQGTTAQSCSLESISQKAEEGKNGI